MDDEIVEEVRRIREQLVEETKTLTVEERRERSHSASGWFQRQIAKYRAWSEVENSSNRQETALPRTGLGEF